MSLRGIVLGGSAVITVATIYATCAHGIWWGGITFCAASTVVLVLAIAAEFRP